MSAGVVHLIRCDVTVNGEQCGSERFWCVPVRNHTELRRLLKAQGWRRTRDGRDICPHCQVAGHR